jgi:hypothetical protein
MKVNFKIVMTVTIKISIDWHLTPCRQLESYLLPLIRTEDDGDSRSSRIIGTLVPEFKALYPIRQHLSW